VVCLPIPTLADDSRLGIVDSLEEQVTIRRGALPVRPLKLKEEVQLHDEIETGNGAMVRIQFGDGATAVIQERSTMRISDESGRPAIDLENGTMYYRSRVEANTADETRSIRTTNAIARTTGNIGLELTRQGDATTTTTICVFEGTASVRALSGAEVQLSEISCVTITKDMLGRVRRSLPIPNLTPAL
jgi:hypothetical protein